ncbi:MAG: tetratricopeptide repeat protein [Planctomycetia bacterium]|nr:tetratricopeptide repeat protein [Planctomycetia bacterium]
MPAGGGNRPGGGGGINIGGGGNRPINPGGGGIIGGGGNRPINPGGGGSIGGGDRPINIGGGGNRPGGGGIIGGGGDRPINIGGGGDRPINIGGGGNRPIIGGGGDRPINIGGGGDRPINIGGGGNNINRPIGGGGNNNIINRPNIGNNNNIINNRQNNINVNNNNFYRPYNNWHSGWTHGYWNYWPRWPVGFVGGASLGWLLAPGDSFVYSNPYYVQQTTVVEQPVVDYSQPIPPPPQQAAAPAGGEAPAPDGTPGVPQEAIQDLDSARAAFKKGDYAGAQKLTERALKLVPSDATLHEFRALTLFAQKKFQEAAAAIYAVLVTGPGWDWDTLKALYPDVATYTAQLRALEDYVKQNPNQADARFLLAYHYLAMGYPDAAAKQLTEVVKLQPKDQLSAELLKSLQKNSGDKPAVGQ